MCGCAKNAAGGGGQWSSSRTRWQVVLSSGASITFGNKADADRHASLHKGSTIQEIRPGMTLKRR